MSNYTKENLPEYVANAVDEVKENWVDIYGTVTQTDGPEIGLIAANNYLNRTIQEKEIVFRTQQVRDRVVFELDTTKEFISRTEDGNDYITFKLANAGKDTLGVTWTEDMFKEWAEKINSGEYVVGDIDHEYYDKLLQAGYSDDDVETMLKTKPGIARAMKAVFQEGALWVKAIIDKRYRKIIEKSKGVSLEAVLTSRPDGTKKADLLGFTFGVKHDPVFKDTKIEM